MKLNPVLIMLLLLVGIAQAATININGCQALAAGNTYVLQNSVTNNATAGCFTTSGTNIILDGQGYTVAQYGGIAAGIYVSQVGFTLRNIVLYNWSQGYSSTVDTNSLQNVTVVNSSSYSIIFQNVALASNIYVNNVSVVNGTRGILFFGGADVNGAVIANSSVDVTNFGLYLNRTNATISHFRTNASIVQDGNRNTATYWNLSMSNYSAFTIYPNKTSDIVYNDISNSTAALVKAYDAVSGTRINATNNTIYAASTTTNYDRYLWIFDQSAYNGTTYTAKIEENIGYYPAWLDLSQSYLRGSAFQLVMIPKTATDVSLINFRVQDNMNNPLVNASCSIWQTYASNWWLVNAKKTESTGIASFYMQTSKQYKIICSAPGYSTFISYVTPTSSDYSIFLTTTSGGIGYPTDVEGVRTTFNSTGPFQWNETQTLTFTIYNTSVNSSLDFFAWVISNGTTALNTQNDSTHPGGGSLNYTFMPGNNSNITVRIIFLRTGRSVVDYTFRIATYYAYPSNPASLQAALVSMGSLGGFTVVIITLIVGAAVGGWVSGISAGAGIAAFLGILTLGFMTVNPILSGLVLLASFMVAGGYFMLRGGGE